MERCKDDIRREFYIKTTRKFGWTKDVLINQLEAGAFERYMANQTNFDKTVPEKYRHQAKLLDENPSIGIILCKRQKPYNRRVCIERYEKADRRIYIQS